MHDLIAPLEDNLCSLWSGFGKAPGGQLIFEPDHMRLETPIAALPYNGVFRFRADDQADARIDAEFDHFRAAEKPFLWLMHPTARPLDLGARLEARGFEMFEELPGMAAPLDTIAPVDPEPEGVTYREVVEGEDLGALLDFILWRWHVPEEWKSFLDGARNVLGVGHASGPTRAWLAWRDGVPVAKAITHETDGVIGLYGVATKEEARGLGLGRGICLKALHEADRGRGLIGVLHSSPMAVSLYEKMGFEHVAPFSLYAVNDGFHV